MKKLIVPSVLALLLLTLFSCGAKTPNSTSSADSDSCADEDTFTLDSVVLENIHVSPDEELYSILYDLHVIMGQKAKRFIVGKFDGEHIDTVFVDADCSGEETKYFLTSKSGRLPKVEIYGCNEMAPAIYAEGDLDGDGTDDIGYLHTWLTSQWRYYRILSFHNKHWMYMFTEEEDYLNTPQYLRCFGVDIATPGTQKGTVEVHWADNLRFEEPYDTIVRPTWTEISTD